MILYVRQQETSEDAK